MDGFVEEVVSRLPLADAALVLVSHVIDERLLESIYQEHRGRSYCGVNAHEDGEVNDAPLVPKLLEQVRGQRSRPRLWIADRQFCEPDPPVIRRGSARNRRAAGLSRRGPIRSGSDRAAGPPLE